MKKVILTAFTATFSFFNASAQWTASGNNIYNTSQGSVSVGMTNAPAKLTVYEGNVLGSVAKNAMRLTTFSGNVGSGNIAYHNIWLVRNAAGNSWYTARIHDGISIDNAFSSPQTDTQTWWERDPSQDLQTWGHHANTYFAIRGGKVGIGTADPGARLTVKDLSPVVQIFDAAINPMNGTRFGKISFGSSGEWAAIEATRSPNSYDDFSMLKFFTSHSPNAGGDGNNMERMRINYNGNVGIGTTDPTEKLSVNGTIRSKRVKVESTGWPDFVFKPTYQLRPLSEVKLYVDKHQHLPEVPSAAEVEKNGHDLGEINKVLLKKVEELTLYLIKKDQEAKNDRAMIKKLQAEVISIKRKLK